jgi:hypothetical protein
MYAKTLHELFTEGSILKDKLAYVKSLPTNLSIDEVIGNYMEKNQRRASISKPKT